MNITTFTYDNFDRLTTKVVNGTTTTYSYDNTNQLTDDGTASYSYDANGNRTMTGYTTGTGNQTTNDGTWTYSYDAEGNLTKKSKGANLETWNYSYDQQNHLVTVEKHATDGGTLQLKVQYKYDALDNRIERTEDSDGDGNVDITERFGYDGQNVWADLNTNNNITYRRLFGPGVDDPVARITAAGTVVWYLTDYQNSVIAMVNSVGSSLGSITYDGFGNTLTDTIGVNGDRYGFTSRELDSVTGQQYNWARYYDPALGKWTSMDPLGFEAGDANLYRYVGNGPTNGVDPSGLINPKFGTTYGGVGPTTDPVPRPQHGNGRPDAVIPLFNGIQGVGELLSRPPLVNIPIYGPQSQSGSVNVGGSPSIHGGTKPRIGAAATGSLQGGVGVTYTGPPIGASHGALVIGHGFSIGIQVWVGSHRKPDAPIIPK